MNIMNTEALTVKEITKGIEAFGKLETKGVELLNKVCNDVLNHVTLHPEPSLINKLVRVCKTANKKLVIEFFKEHSIFKFNTELDQFGKKKDKVGVEASILACDKFHSVYMNDIMSWYNDNIKVEKAKTPLIEQVLNKINTGLKKGELDPKELIQHLINNDKMLEAIFDCIEEKQGA